jgi:Anti-sigma-D factor RsdA to sigma factor binding region
VTGRDGFPRAGYSTGDSQEMPVDLAAMQADDTLLDILGSGGAPGDASDELTRVLAGWRREVDAEPVGELVDTNTALAVIRAARQPAARRNGVFGSIAAAGAVLVIALSAVGLVAKSAQPGDHLWGVTQVLYSDYARSVETAAAVRTELNEANTALRENKPDKARASLQRVQHQLPVIGETEGRTDLTARHRDLEQILKGPPQDSSATPPGDAASPPSAPTTGRPEATPSPTSSKAPLSAEPTTTSNATTPPDTTTSAPTSTVAPHHNHPGPGYPSHGSTGIDYPGSGSPDGASAGSGGSPGRHPSGAGSSAAGTTGGDGAPGSDGAPGRGSPASDHANAPPGGGVAPGCEHTGPRSPYCP